MEGLSMPDRRAVLRKGLSYRKIFMMNLPDVLRNA